MSSATTDLRGYDKHILKYCIPFCYYTHELLTSSVFNGQDVAQKYPSLLVSLPEKIQLLKGLIKDMLYI